MPSDAFIRSVEQLIADEVTWQALGEIQAPAPPEQAIELRSPLGYVIEDTLKVAILAALAQARKQLALSRVGTMTFPEAMQAVANGKWVTRPGWGILRSLL